MLHAVFMLHHQPAQTDRMDLIASATVDAFFAYSQQDNETSHQSLYTLHKCLQSICVSVMPD